MFWKMVPCLPRAHGNTIYPWICLFPLLGCRSLNGSAVARIAPAAQCCATRVPPVSHPPHPPVLFHETALAVTMGRCVYPRGHVTSRGRRDHNVSR